MKVTSKAFSWVSLFLGSATLFCLSRAAHAGDSQASSSDKAPSEKSARDKPEGEAESDESNGDPSATGVPIEVASKAQKEVARKQLQLGIDLLDAGKHAQALEVLRMSFQRVASPNTRLMIARVLQKLDRYPEAYIELQLALAESSALARGASKYDDTVEAIEAELGAVRPKVALVYLDLGMSVTSGGQVVEPERWGQPLVLPAGETVFELKLTNGQSQRAAVQLEGGQELKVPLLLQPQVAREVTTPAPAQRNVAAQPIPSDAVSRKSLAWVGVGIAGVGAASFAVFGLLDRARYERLQDQCTETSCPSALRDDAEMGRTYQSLANVGIGVSAVGLLTAAYFFLTADGARPELDTKRQVARAPMKRPPTLMLAPSKVDSNSSYIVLGTNSVTLTGRF